MGDAWPLGNSFNGRMGVAKDMKDLLREELYVYLEQAEELGREADQWTEEQQVTAHDLLADLVTVIRGILVFHSEVSGRCRRCGTPWPCEEYETVHRLVQAPDAELVTLQLARNQLVYGEQAATA